MRVLLCTWGWPSHFFPLVQLGWALQAAGHEVRVASQPGLASAVAAAGMTPVPVGTDRDLSGVFAPFHEHLAAAGRPIDMAELLERFGAGTISLYTEFAADMVPDTLAFATVWRPDLVVFEPTTFAGPVVAAALGVPAVRHIWGIDFTHLTSAYETEALRELTDRLAIAPVDTLGAATIDPCPPSLQDQHPVRRLPMQYVPYNGPATLPRWLWSPPSRPRVCVTGGTVAGRYEGAGTPFEVRVLDALAGLDVEVVVVNPLAPLENRPGVRVVDRVAMHLLLPTCALAVHSGGGGMAMTAIHSGTPQLLVPRLPDHIYNARRIAAAGAGRFLYAAHEDPALLREHAVAVLESVRCKEITETLRAEMAAAPAASVVVDQLQTLTVREAGHAG